MQSGYTESSSEEFARELKREFTLTGSKVLSAGPQHIRKFVIFTALAAFTVRAIENYLAYVGSDGRIISGDYSIFRFASKLLWNGHALTLFNPPQFMAEHTALQLGAIGFAPFPYPPNGVWFVAPLDFLPDRLGLVLWLGATFAVFAWLICRRLARPWLSALVLLVSPASFVNISAGQNGFLTGALLCGGLLLLGESPILAGLLIGLLTYKPQFGLLLPFVLLAGGHYRTCFVAAAVTVALVLGSLWLFGTTAWSEYFSIALGVQRGFMEQGMGSAILTTPSVFIGGRLLGLPLAVDYVMQAIAAVIVVIACTLTFARRSVGLEVKAALVMIGAFLVTPYCSSSDLCVVSAAQLLLIGRGTRLSPVHWLLHGVVWAMPLLMIIFGLAHLPLGPVALSALLGLELKRIYFPSRPALPTQWAEAPIS